MNEYIIYTVEGYTEAPNPNYEVENCQVLGRVFGRDKIDAINNLLKENTWILKAGFHESEFVVCQLATI